MVVRWNGKEAAAGIAAAGVVGEGVAAEGIAAGGIVAGDGAAEKRLVEGEEEQEEGDNTAGAGRDGSSIEQRCRWEQQFDQRLDLSNLI